MSVFSIIFSPVIIRMRLALQYFSSAYSDCVVAGRLILVLINLFFETGFRLSQLAMSLILLLEIPW